MTAPIVGFLLERIAEDEERARRSLGLEVESHPLTGQWEVRTGQPWQWDVVDANGRDVVYLQPGEGGGAVTEQVADHVASHDPERVLSEARVKRWLVTNHQTRAQVDPCCTAGEPCDLLRELASVYRRHDDWDRTCGPVVRRGDPAPS